MPDKSGMKFSNLQIVAAGYAAVILAGACLLMLPVSAREGAATPLQAFFTAVSASCVTGLVLVDTGVYWSLFGQITILFLIQIGGLGFMTISVRLLLLLRRRVRLRYREVMVESINSTQIGGILRLTKEIVAGTLFFELTGAALLAIRFVPEFGWGKGIYYSVFHAVSAFCNAGFDLMGEKAAFSSLMGYRGDLLVNLTVMALIIIGGLGFLVWEDLLRNRLHWRKYRLQTKIVLSVTAALLLGGMAGTLWMERDGVFTGMGAGEQAMAALFQSCTARTAGFNTVDTAALSDGGKLLTMLLMFIGGSPGSTAGGVKTTTLMVLLVYAVSSIRHEQDAHIFGRSLTAEILRKAVTVFMLHILLASTGVLLLLAIQPLPLTDALFEVFSALGTVGMTTGVTRSLEPASCCVVMFLMYCGRVGSASFAVALLEKKARPPVRFPEERITVG